MILETAFMCMALNIYHEAKFQSMLGQIAVGQVVMNRVEDSRFPDNVCDVVTQAVTYKGTDKPVLHKCQFSWYCNGESDEPKYDSEEWWNAQEYASIVLSGTIALVRGYETISPAGYRGDDYNIIKLFRTAENRQTSEITNQFTYYYEPLESGD